MRILIVGAGGIGATYGAHLLEAGHDVTFVARGEHLEAMRSHGLEVRHEGFRFAGPVDAIDEDQLLAERHVGDVDVVVLAFKAQATEPWLEKAEAWLWFGDTPLLSLQNGVDNEPAIARCVGAARTYGGLAVRIGGHVERPGLVVATGPAQVVMGVWPDAARGEADPAVLHRLEAAFR
ncbi:MAG: 2-dehydropantoate 2-reductase N-terminal domain-containing protein, partial [Trueperaceae bacterium]|nr:2-dehydropantoate 2-reductase N-terminal domain-containing protein [Trueperaceae bacterium]